MKSIHIVFVVGVAIIVVAGLAQFVSFGTSVSAPESPADIRTPITGNIATSTSSKVVTMAVQQASDYLIPIERGDVIASWDSGGYLNDGGVREAEVRSRIIGLKNATGAENDYQRYITLAQEYDSLGDGKSSYENLSHAIAADPNQTSGVAWHNMGILMEKLGAYQTAKKAHLQAIAIQPGISSFHISLLELMIYHFTNDAQTVEKAFKDAEAFYGAESPMLLDLRNRWKALLQ